jgi:nucleotide-binding universal stress UspA family protein
MPIPPVVLTTMTTLEESRNGGNSETSSAATPRSARARSGGPTVGAPAATMIPQFTEGRLSRSEQPLPAMIAAMRILFAYDGSDSAKAAMDDLQYAGLTGTTEAVVLSVADTDPRFIDQPRTPNDPLSNLAIQRLTERARAEANRKMTDARQTSEDGAQQLRQTFSGWTVRPEAVAGAPALSLIKRAEELNVDLLVVGSQGRSALGRVMLGSVSQKILQHAPCSVRVGRGGKPDRLAKVLIGVDGSKGAASAVSAVAARMWPMRTEVRVVTAADERVLLSVLAAMQWERRSPPDATNLSTNEQTPARQMLESVAEELRRSGLSADTVLRDGDPKNVLLQEANDWGADCIFVGAQGLSAMERFLLGSVSSSVAARAGCSVEVVRF